MDFLPQEDRATYEAIFLQHAKNSVIEATVVQSYLAQSGLPNQTLGSIWNLSIRNGSSITFPEFALSMFLAKSVMNGMQLPIVLPPHIAAQISTAMSGGIINNQQVVPPVAPSGSSSGSFGNLDIKPTPAIDPNREWAVLPDEKQRYDQIFKSSDAGNLGYISGESAKLIFSQSGLRENMLAHIWGLADMQKRGKLNSDEFAVAMHLIYKKLNGYDLPKKLPDNLVPPSQKALSSLSNFAKLDALQQKPQKRISPSSSLLSLSSVATQDRPVTPAALAVDQDAEREEREREAILQLVEAKRLEVAQAKEFSDKMKNQLFVVEKRISEASEQSLAAANDLKLMNSKKNSKNSGDILSVLEKTLFHKLGVDIPIYIADCRKFYAERAKNQIQKINVVQAFSEGPSSKDAVVNRAAALLAERMAALGVKSTLSTSSSSSSSKPESPSGPPKPDKNELLQQVEQEKTLALAKINEFETRFTLLSAKIRRFLAQKPVHDLSKSAKNSSASIKYESGIGLLTKEALDLFQKLKQIREAPVPVNRAILPTKQVISGAPFTSAAPLSISKLAPSAVAHIDEAPAIASTFQATTSAADFVNPLPPSNHVVLATTFQTHIPSTSQISSNAALVTSLPQIIPPSFSGESRSPALPSVATLQPFPLQSEALSYAIAPAPIDPSNPFNFTSGTTGSFATPSFIPSVSPIAPVYPPVEDKPAVISFGYSEGITIINDGPPLQQPEIQQQNTLSVFQLMKEKEKQAVEAKKAEELLVKKRSPSPKHFEVLLQSSAHNASTGGKSANSAHISLATKPFASHLPPTSQHAEPSKPNPFLPKELSAGPVSPAVPVGPTTTAVPLQGPPPPPPPPPLVNSDGSAVAIKSKAVGSADIASISVEKRRPTPADIGAKGPNLFALLQDSRNNLSSKGSGNQVVAASVCIAPKRNEIPQQTAEHHEISPTQNPVSRTSAAEPIGAAPSSISPTPITVNINSPSEESDWQFVTNAPLKSGDSDEIRNEIGPFNYEVVAQFDYEGGEGTDLPASIGDILKVEKEDDEWIYCRNASGRKGWIPRSFTAPVDIPQSVDDLRSPEEIVETPLGSAEVMYDFEARNPDEISCLAGQVVYILAKSEAEWWLVEHSGQRGLIPSNFLQERTVMLKGINDVEAIKDASLERNPFGSAALLFSPSASEFPVIEDDENDLNNGSAEDFSRKEAVSEMVKTERSYVEDLMIVKSYFLTPMSKMTVDMLLLFSNFLQIVEVNSAVLRDFEVAFMDGESLGGVFLKHLDHLQCYKLYCENLSGASTYLQKLRSSNPTLQGFLKSQQNLPVCKHLDLSSYLLIPMQRITRYALLLRQILHYTPKTHRHYDPSMIALQMSEELLEQINHAIKLRQSILNVERIIKMVDLEIPSEQYRLDLKAPTRMMGSRTFLYEGVLLKSKSGRKLTAYLFNDFLMLVHLKGSGQKPYTLYKQPIMLDSLTVMDTADTDSFQITFDDQTILLRALNVSEKRQWINQIELARKACRDVLVKKAQSSILNPFKAIGTLSVLLCEARNCKDTVKTREIFAMGQIGGQSLKSKVVPISFQHATFKQKLIFTLPSLDEVLQISLFRYNKYSEDVYLGQAEMQLDILEYYAGKATDVIELPMKDKRGGFDSLTIRLSLKK